MNEASVTAGGFVPGTSNVLVVTSSRNEVYVLDVEAKQLGEWSRRHTHHLPRRFREFPGEVIGLAFPPRFSHTHSSVIVYSSRYLQKVVLYQISSGHWLVVSKGSFACCSLALCIACHCVDLEHLDAICITNIRHYMFCTISSALIKSNLGNQASINTNKYFNRTLDESSKKIRDLIVKT
jgi:hypothetical protein